jgi:hypothetical protein
MTSQRAAVHKACEELGIRTSRAVLAKRATLHYGGEVTERTAGLFRKDYCRHHKIPEVDCRTYGKQGQFRRNMLDDTQVDLGQVQRINNFLKCLKNSKYGLGVLKSLIGPGKGQFHSIDQMKYAINNWEELQQPTAAAA